MSRRSIYRIVLLVVVVITVLGLPIAAGAQSSNGITSVKDGATVSGKVDIKGTANDPAFSKWQLDLLPGGKSDAAIFLATDTKPGEFSYALDTTKYPDGEHALRLRVVRPDGNYSEYVTKVAIANLAAKPAAAAPVVASTAAVTATVATTATVAATPAVAAAAAPAVNGIASPKDGASVSGKVDVKGTANDPAFSKWQLDLLPGGKSDAAIFLAVGNQPGDLSYALDTTGLPNGQHALRLRVVRNDSNYSEYINKFTIANGGANAAAAAPAAKDIVATAIGAGQFKTLVAAVQAAGLVEALQGKGPFTVFAPTDAAFAALPAGTVEGLLKDPKALSNILLYHVVPGEVKAAAVKDGLTANTLQGAPVSFKITNGKPSIQGANIVATDVMASNGVIHVIDKVILPPAAPVTTTVATTATVAATPAVAAAAAPAVNGIASPKDGASVSGKVDVKGTANDPAFSKWQLDLLPGGKSDAAIFLATDAKPGEFSYALDTTKYPDGEHALRLRVVRPDGNYSEYVTKVKIANTVANK